MQRSTDLVKATLTHLGKLESITVLWNPESYHVSRRTRLAAVPALGESVSPAQAVAGGEEEFSTVLLLDSTRIDAAERDLVALAAKLASWMEVAADSVLPDAVLFTWGAFRFRGYLTALDESWVQFAADGLPTRGWLHVTLRR